MVLQKVGHVLPNSVVGCLLALTTVTPFGFALNSIEMRISARSPPSWMTHQPRSREICPQLESALEVWQSRPASLGKKDSQVSTDTRKCCRPAAICAMRPLYARLPSEPDHIELEHPQGFAELPALHPSSPHVWPGLSPNMISWKGVSVCPFPRQGQAQKSKTLSVCGSCEQAGSTMCIRLGGTKARRGLVDFSVSKGLDPAPN